MKVNRENLINALGMVSPGLANRELIEQSASFVFIKGNVHSYNDELSVSHPVNFNIEGAVSAKELYNLLGKTKEDELDFSSSETGMLIKGKQYKANIQFQKEISLPIFDGGVINSWEDLPPDFIEGLKACMFTVGRDMTEPVLTCFHVHDNCVETCDRHRLTRYYFDVETHNYGSDQRLLIPFNAARALVKYDVIQYAVSDNWLHFSSEEGTLFSCRTYAGLVFPDLQKLLIVEGDSIKFPSDMLEVLGRAEIFSNSDVVSGQLSKINIALKEGKIIVRSKKDTGSFEESCRIRYSGAPAQFSINSTFLTAILKKNSVATLGANRLKFANDKFVHVQVTQPAMDNK